MNFVFKLYLQTHAQGPCFQSSQHSPSLYQLAGLRTGDSKTIRAEKKMLDKEEKRCEDREQIIRREQKKRQH